MASFAGDRPNLPAPADPNDPFVTTARTTTNAPETKHHRYSTFDYELFAAGPGSSPRQAKRSLEAHLAETERRLEEAGKLGKALVSQRKALEDQLQEVDKLQSEGELQPELKQKFVDIEKEYNDLARESARAFLPKQRIPSNEANPGSPFVAEGRSGRRSVSPSKFESQATGSPTKLSVPNRKIRNQPSNRVHDIEFAAEISTSLIAQVRNLQSLLAERDEEVRDFKNDKSSLEIESETLQQRVKTLDESEHRYKEENWNLETRLQELTTLSREANDREKKLTLALTTASTDKTATQKELDESKLSQSKLSEEYAAAVKHHDIELGTAKRNISSAEGERTAMQRKIDELTNQNQELAKAFSTQRGRALERDHVSGQSEDDFETANDTATPEHSPPPSPIKGTPRHSMLESETLKTSLHHAQRTIQSQRSQIHREKTEKLELRRIIQDLRDEVDKQKNDNGNTLSNRKNRKADSKEFKKPPRLLGNFRASRQDIIVDDAEWEDHQETGQSNAAPAARPKAIRNDSTDQFDTANEASESAFETANERATETEDFQTGNEAFSDDDDAETETESTSRGFGKMKRPPSLYASLARQESTEFDSTASTSADEDDRTEIKTPTTSFISNRSRFRLSRGALGRNSRQVSEEPNFRSSPISVGDSLSGTPSGGQTLFAELQDFDGSDDESIGIATPSRRSARSVTPGSTRRAISPPPAVPALPKLIMVDSGVMTDPVHIEDAYSSLPTFLPLPADGDFKRPQTMESVVAPAGNRASVITSIPEDTVSSRPLSTFSYSDAGAQFDPDMVAKLAEFPVPPTSRMAPSTPPTLTHSLIQTEHVEPLEELPQTPPTLSLTTIINENLEPVEELQVTPPELSMTQIVIENLEPIMEPAVVAPTLSLTSITNEHLEPIMEPEAILANLSLSTVQVESVEPIVAPEVVLPELSMTSIKTEAVEPVAEPELPQPLLPMLSMSAISREHVESVAEPERQVSLPPRPSLALSTIVGEHVEPIAEPERETLPLPLPLPVPVPVASAPEPSQPELPQLSMMPIVSETVEPTSEPDLVIALPSLGLSSISSQNWEPRHEPEIVPPVIPLGFSNISTQHVEPIADAEPLPPVLAFTPLFQENIHPVYEPPASPPALALSDISAEFVEPISPAPTPIIAPVRTIPEFGYSNIESIGTEPVSPRSPRRDGFVLPKDRETTEQPETPKNRTFGSILGFNRKQDSPTLIAEDDTRQSLGDTSEAETPESQRPFKEISSNASTRPDRKPLAITSDQSAQTALTAEAIDELLRSGSQPAFGHGKSTSVSSIGTPGTTGTVRIHRPLSRDESPTPDHRQALQDSAAEAETLRRPTSAASRRTSIQDAPPLPANHRALIEAARTGSASGQSANNMPPPTLSYSQMKKDRPHTPQRTTSSHSVRGTPTPRAKRTNSTQGRADMQSSMRLSARSRQSSVSSFASEIDNRFNMHAGMGIDPTGFGPNTDPRMIQAITQTMIGEYLWKYTRKTGRGEMSEKRHRRYFWVHPYTRTLYWGDRDPSAAGRSELKAKSVPIEAVRVVTDDNPMPPGLHRKSLVVISPGRTIKFTCTTGQRHETWFNALSYLLQRTAADGQADVEEVAGNITREDVDEFNPQYSTRPANGTRPQAPPSLSSYNSRTTRNESPAFDVSIPTLNHQRSSGAGNRASVGTRSKLNGYWKTSGSKFSGTFSSLRGRGPNAPTPDIYEASEVHDSAEDLREVIERQDREADRLENVRACCDGKHDVGSLPHAALKKRQSHTHAHPGPSASTRSRA